MLKKNKKNGNKKKNMKEEFKFEHFEKLELEYEDFVWVIFSNIRNIKTWSKTCLRVVRSVRLQRNQFGKKFGWYILKNRKIKLRS